jgi:hypothetical protein
MATEWVNIGTGQKSSSNPGSIYGPHDAVPGIYNNGMNANHWQQRWVPDPPAPVQFSSAPTYPRPYVGTGSTGSSRRTYTAANTSNTGSSVRQPMSRSARWTIILALLVALFWLIGLSVLRSIYFSGERTVQSIGYRIFQPQPTIVGSTYNYPASEVMKFPWLHRDVGSPVHLNGRTVVVTGDVIGAHIHANGNIVFQGSLTDSTVVDNDWTINATNVSRSALTARQIVITGTAVGNTTTRTSSVGMNHPLAKRRH